MVWCRVVSCTLFWTLGSKPSSNLAGTLMQALRVCLRPLKALVFICLEEATNAELVPFRSGLTCCMSCAGQDTFFCTRNYDAEKGELEEAEDSIKGVPAAQAAAAKVRQGSSLGLSECLSTQGPTLQPEALHHVPCCAGLAGQALEVRQVELPACRARARLPHLMLARARLLHLMLARARLQQMQARARLQQMLARARLQLMQARAGLQLMWRPQQQVQRMVAGAADLTRAPLTGSAMSSCISSFW